MQNSLFGFATQQKPNIVSFKVKNKDLMNQLRPTIGASVYTNGEGACSPIKLLCALWRDDYHVFFMRPFHLLRLACRSNTHNNRTSSCAEPHKELCGHTVMCSLAQKSYVRADLQKHQKDKTITASCQTMFSGLKLPVNQLSVIFAS